MKYWLLTSEYPPFYGGGISTYCLNTAKMFSKQGNDVTVFVNDASVKDVDIIYREGSRIIRFNPNRTGCSSFLGHVTNLSYEFANIVKQYILKEGKPDIIESQEYLGIAYYLLQFKYLKYSWCRDVPVLITMHSPAFLYLEYNHVPLYRYPNYWIGEMERFCIQAADIVISPSRFLIEEVGKQFKYNHSNFAVVPNPFEVEVVESAHIAENNHGEIIFFGKLSAQKGIFKLLTYFVKLWEEGFSAPLVMIGGQDIVYHPEGRTMGDVVRKQFKKYVESGLIRLEKRIAPSQIRHRLQNAKVVIIPSTVDNLPYVVMEMMSLGLIVLVSKQGGQAEIVTDSIDGFVFDHEAEFSFSKQLAEVLNLSEEQRDTISKNAIKRIKETYNAATIYDQKIKAINSVLRQERETEVFPSIRTLGAVTDRCITQSSKGLLSIVIPYYNMGSYIQETIESVLNSSIALKEIIIVNDGSTDSGSISKLTPYRSKPAFKVVDVPNQGLANARNLGAQHATGEFLAFLDADDLVTPDYYTKSVEVLSSYENVHFVGAWTKYFEGSNDVWPTFSPEPPLILYHNLVNSSSLVYKRNSFILAGTNDKNMPFKGLEDYDSVISMIRNNYYGVVLPEVHFHYRVRKDSMIRGISRLKKDILYDYISRKHKDFYATFASEIASLINSNGSGSVLDNPTLDFNPSHKIPFNNYLSRRIISIVKKNPAVKSFVLRAYNKFK